MSEKGKNLNSGVIIDKKEGDFNFAADQADISKPYTFQGAGVEVDTDEAFNTPEMKYVDSRKVPKERLGELNDDKVKDRFPN